MGDSTASRLAEDLGITGVSRRAIWLGLALQIVATVVAAGLLKLADLATSNLIAVLAVSSGLLGLSVAVLLYFLFKAYSRVDETNAELEAANASVRLLEKWTDLEDSTGLSEYKTQLKSSEEHPREKLPAIETELCFMGNGGSKWTRQNEEFDAMLRRTADNQGNVRFLLLDPNSKVCTSASKVRFGNSAEQPRRIVESLCKLKAWDQMFGHLEVRLYSHTPHFRISLIDKSHIVLGHYREYQNDSAETPLLVFSRKDVRWSFYSPFAGYYEHEWKNADRVKWPDIECLADKYGVSHD